MTVYRLVSMLQLYDVQLQICNLVLLIGARFRVITGVSQGRRRLKDGGVGDSCDDMTQCCNWLVCILQLCGVRLQIGNLALQIWALIGAIKTIFGWTQLTRYSAARGMHDNTLLLSIQSLASRMNTIATQAIATVKIAIQKL